MSSVFKAFGAIPTRIGGTHPPLALAYAGLGRREEAIGAAQRAIDLLPITKDAFWGELPLMHLALVHTRFGETEEALEVLDGILAVPSWLSIGLIEVDSRWEQLRVHPQYPELVKKYWTVEAP